MEIHYLGHSCFRIKGKEVTIITDPYSPEIGLKLPKKLEADIVTTSHGHLDHAYAQAVRGNYFKVGGPGEYEVRGVFITGIPSFHDKKQGTERGKNTIYVMEIEDFRICHLGDLGHLLSDEEVEAIGDIDILLIPVGGQFTIGAKEAAEVVSALQPRIIIPMHYRSEKVNLELEDVGNFCKEMGAGAKCEAQDKLVLKKTSLPEDTEELVILKIRK